MSLAESTSTETFLDNVNSPLESDIVTFQPQYRRTYKNTPAYRKLKRNMVFGFENEKVNGSLFSNVLAILGLITAGIGAYLSSLTNINPYYAIGFGVLLIFIGWFYDAALKPIKYKSVDELKNEIQKDK